MKTDGFESSLNKLNVYIRSIEMGDCAWAIYTNLTFGEKKIIGDQFIRAVDSVGANIAEGYGRFHYLDRIKFYYNARGSLIETNYWFNLFEKRRIISDKILLEKFPQLYEETLRMLNSFIKATYNQKFKE